MQRLPQTARARRRRLRTAAALVTVAVLVVLFLTRSSSRNRTRPKGLAASGDITAQTDPKVHPRAVTSACMGTPSSYAPGVPPNTDCHNIYSADGPGQLSPQVRGDPSRIYVPNLKSDTVSVIDPSTYQTVATIAVGLEPQHVVPSWDLQTLWVNNDKGNSVTPINPRTMQAGPPIPVEDPYNLYFTPDSTRSVVMAEALAKMDFRDPHTMALRHSLTVPCNGLNHLDFSADGRTAVASCEFDGKLLLVDMTNGQEKVLAAIHIGGMPQDVKLSPDGTAYYVADMQASGVHVIDATTFAQVGFVPTGKGAHGLYPSRDGRDLYVSNRGEGSVAVVDVSTRTVTAKWVFDRGHGSPDMGGVSADGRVLWLSGRSDNEMYAISTQTGLLVVPPIKVGLEPHGACVWPQPGRYSIGHTGVMR